MTISDCKLIELPQMADARGSLSFVESNKHIPFEIKRIYYLYDTATGVERGAHGHKKLEQLIFPLNGSFEIEIDDGENKTIYQLTKPNVGLYVAPMIWRDLRNFSPNVVCMVLASDYYDEADYYRQYDNFIRSVRAKQYAK